MAQLPLSWSRLLATVLAHFAALTSVAAAVQQCWMSSVLGLAAADLLPSYLWDYTKPAVAGASQAVRRAQRYGGTWKLTATHL